MLLLLLWIRHFHCFRPSVRTFVRPFTRPFVAVRERLRLLSLEWMSIAFFGMATGSKEEKRAAITAASGRIVRR